MINKIINRYSFLSLEIISLILLKWDCLILKYTFSTELEIAYGFFIVFFLGSLSIPLVIYIFELIFPNIRIPQRITNSKIYKILFFLGIIFIIINISALILPILDNLIRVLIFCFFLP